METLSIDKSSKVGRILRGTQVVKGEFSPNFSFGNVRIYRRVERVVHIRTT